MVMPDAQNLTGGIDTCVADRHPITHLKEWMSQFGSALIAYSGGVDGAGHGGRPRMPRRSLPGLHRGIAELSPAGIRGRHPPGRALGVRYRVVRTEEHLDPNYAANPHNRCYFCKSELYQRLRQVAAEMSADVILDGTNASDLNDHRPGHAAAKECGVRSPLAELGFTKDAVRLLVPTWICRLGRPASPCLASRVPTGVPVVPEVLRQIEQAEDALAGLGFADFRVRHHGDIAGGGPAAGDASRLDRRDDVVAGIRAAGYRFVCLDLVGFKSGSLNILQ